MRAEFVGARIGRFNTPYIGGARQIPAAHITVRLSLSYGIKSAVVVDDTLLVPFTVHHHVDRCRSFVATLYYCTKTSKHTAQ